MTNYTMNLAQHRSLELTGSCYASDYLNSALLAPQLLVMQERLESTGKQLDSVLRPYKSQGDYSQNRTLQKKLKGKIRKGIALSRTRDLGILLWNLPMASQVYNKIRAAQLETGTNTFPCPAFGSPLIPVPTHFLSPDGFAATHRVLWAINESCPNVQYCPLLLSFVSLLVLFYTESESYSLVIALFKHSEAQHKNPNMKWHFGCSEFQYRHLFQAVRNLASEKLGQQINLLERQGLDVCALADSLISSLFIGKVHVLILFRLLSCFINEGMRVMVRFTLGVLKTLKLKLVGLTSVPDVLALIATELAHAETAEKAFAAGLNLHLPETLRQFRVEALLADSTPLHVTYTRLRTKVNSAVLSQAQFERVWQELPERFKLANLECVYSSDSDGIHLPTLIRRSASHSGSLGMILTFETLDSWRFGLFVDTWVRVSLDYIGGSDSFFFIQSPREEYFPIMTDNLYVLQVSRSEMIIGEGPHGPAIRLGQDLARGYSAVSATFNNAIIGKDGEFVCKTCELFALTH